MAPDEPVTAKGVRRRATLLAEAVARFAAEGFSGTSVSDIARAAGITPAATYAYFPSKEALYEAAVQADIDGLLDIASTASQEERPGLGLFVRLLAELPDHPLAERILREGSVEEVRLIIDSPVVRTLREQTEAFLRHRQERGRIPATHAPDVLATGVETLVFALLAMRLRAGDPTPERIAGIVAVFDSVTGGPPDLDELPLT